MKTISKVQVVHEDIAIGTGKVIQQRGTESVTVQQVELAWIFRTTTEIRGLDVAKYTRIQLHQQGSAIEYWYDATSIVTDDGSSALKPDAIDISAAGRWLSTGTGIEGSIPLAGTLLTAPVTGPIHFDNSLDQQTYKMQSDIVGPDSFGFLTERDGTSFVIATSSTGGEIKGFTFNEDGRFTLPSADGSNQEGWQIGAGEIFGDTNILIIAPIDALGNTLIEPVTIITAPNIGTVFNTDGSITLSKDTVVTDPDNSLTTKGYVDALFPPAGGEANTTSSPSVSGEELTMAKSGIDLPFKKLIAGTDITLTATIDGITIDGTAGGGGGLPAGLVNQGLRNLVGTNTYEATAGLLIDSTGQVSVGPGSLAPAVPFQVEGTALLRSGGQLNFNNPTNSSTGYILNDATNRLQVVSANAGGIDISGLSSTGAAVKIKANLQDVFVAQGNVNSWAQLMYGGAEVLKTTVDGVEITGDLTVVNVSASAQIGASSFAASNLTNGGRLLRTGAFGLIEESGSVVSDFLAVGAKAADSELLDGIDSTSFVQLTGVQQISGKKEFNGQITVGNPSAQPSSGIDLVVAGTAAFEGMVSTSGATVVNSFGVLGLFSSDERLKEDITDNDLGIDAVMQLRPVNFKWKEGGEYDSGFIAQEVQKIIPEAVPTNPDGMLGLKEIPIVAALVKAVQEQQSMIDNLVSRIEELSNG